MISNAYHLVQLTLKCNRQPIVCKQRRGTLTIFLGSEILHSSSINEYDSNLKYLAIGMGCVQKLKPLSLLNKRSDAIMEKFVNFK